MTGNEGGSHTARAMVAGQDDVFGKPLPAVDEVVARLAGVMLGRE